MWVTKNWNSNSKSRSLSKPGSSAHPLPDLEWHTRRRDEVVHRVLTDGKRQAFSRVIELRASVDSTVEHTESVTYDVMASVLSTVRQRIWPVADIAVVDAFLVNPSACVETRRVDVLLLRQNCTSISSCAVACRRHGRSFVLRSYFVVIRLVLLEERVVALRAFEYVLVHMEVANVFEVGSTQRHEGFVLLRIVVHGGSFVRQRVIQKVPTDFVASLLWLEVRLARQLGAPLVLLDATLTELLCSTRRRKPVWRVGAAVCTEHL
jgi:hypothetical protein